MRAQLEDRPTLGSLVGAAARTLAAAGVESPRLDAEILIAEALGVARAQVIPVSAETVADACAVARCCEFVAKRAVREPLAYIVGHKEFFSLDFEVTPAVLIPRPETESVVTAALEAIAKLSDPIVLDLGTGSGAIAIAIAANAPKARVVATDVSRDALEVARRNSARLGVANRIDFLQGDCWESLAGHGMERRFDLIVSNPPYVEDPEVERLAPEIVAFEPRLALAGGPDGLGFHRRIVGGLSAFRKPHATLILEIAVGQGPSVAAMCRAAGCADVAVLSDLAGIDRVVRSRWYTEGSGVGAAGD
jgi:release factor glutamine methyltransferase